jgi:acetyltransferase
MLENKGKNLDKDKNKGPNKDLKERGSKDRSFNGNRGRNLNRVFNPKSIAVIGATDRPNSVGRGLCQNLLEGKEKRKIYFVNPYKKLIFGCRTYPRIVSIKNRIDLAIIAVPAKIVPRVVKDCAQKNVGGIVIISAGFAEMGKKGKKLQEEIVKILKGKEIALIGPNCLGVIRPKIQFNATFAPATPKKGEIAFISQSGALIDSVIDKSLNENWGFSTIISYGNEAGLSLVDFLKWVAEDRETKVIALYLEGLKEGRKFFETTRKIAKRKPIVVLRGGKSKQAQRAVASHTGMLAKESKIYSVAFKQAGIIETETLQELFDVSKALAWQNRCQNGIGIITNGGGAGVLTADYCQELDIKLPKLKKETLKKLEKSKIMHPGYSRSNPLDIVGDALSDRYKIAIEALVEQENIKGLIIIQTLQIMTEVKKNAKIIVEAKKRWKEKPIIGVFMGGKLSAPGIEILEKNKIPNYPDPKRAVKAMRALII